MSKDAGLEPLNVVGHRKGALSEKGVPLSWSHRDKWVGECIILILNQFDSEEMLSVYESSISYKWGLMGTIELISSKQTPCFIHVSVIYLYN